MANQLAGGYGLRPIGITGSGANTTGTTQYEIAATEASVIYQGGMVIPTAAGTIDVADGTVSPLGVFNGCEYVDSNTKKRVFSNYWPGASNASVDTNFPVIAHVFDNPMQLFVVAADGGNTDRATALADVFSNCSMATLNGGSTNNGRSTDLLDISTAATTNTLDVRIVGLYDEEGNTDYASAYHQYVVRILGHFNTGLGAAVGTVATTGI